MGTISPAHGAQAARGVLAQLGAPTRAVPTGAGQGHPRCNACLNRPGLGGALQGLARTGARDRTSALPIPATCLIQHVQAHP
eukprot:7079989-Alexandrium_andersonii.AAC.1